MTFILVTEVRVVWNHPLIAQVNLLPSPDDSEVPAIIRACIQRVGITKVNSGLLESLGGRRGERNQVHTGGGAVVL